MEGRRLIPALSTLGAATSADEGTRDRVLASSCVACHGPSGKSPGDPTIHGKSAAFIEERLEAFKNGSEESTLIGRLAKGCSDAEIGVIAAYIAGLSPRNELGRSE